MVKKIKDIIIKNKLQFSISGVLIVLYLVFIIANPRVFLSFDIYYAFLSIIPFALILAISVTLVIILGEIDLSFPSIMGISSFIFTIIFKQTNNIYLAFICCLFIGMIAGAINSFLIVKVKIPSLIATIGMMYLWRGLVFIGSSGVGMSIVEANKTVLYKILVGRIAGLIPMQAVWAVIIAILFALILNRHRFGAHILFTGDDSVSAGMMGVNINRVKMIAFIQVGLFAAFVGVLINLEILNFWTTTGEGYLMKTLASVFIGGTSVYGGMGTIFGTFIGAIIMGSLEAGIISSGASGFWIQFIYGLVIIISLMIYSYVNRRFITNINFFKIFKRSFNKQSRK